jgi:hypothetical protein
MTARAANEVSRTRRSRTALWALLGLLVFAWIVGLAMWLWRNSPEPDANADTAVRPKSQASKNENSSLPSNGSKTYAELMEERARLDETVWGKEVLAQQHERTIVRLWDDLRAASDPWAVLESLPWESLVIGTFGPSESWEHDIRYATTTSPYRRLSSKAIRGTIDSLRKNGYRLDQSEWRHEAFVPSQNGEAARSTIDMTLHISSRDDHQRWIVQGEVEVTWSQRQDSAGRPLPAAMEARKLALLSRRSPPAFEQIAVLEPPVEAGRRNDPLMVYDLDRDGRCEIILGARNLMYRHRGGDRFEPATFCNGLPTSVMPAMLLADFNGDAAADLAYIHIDRGGDSTRALVLRLVTGQPDGKLIGPGEKVYELEGESPIVMTAGDIDHDGDLDLWIGQYRLSHRHGQMPTPYYDANDGFPAYLLRNDGDGRFSDITEEAGLGKKRRRRTYGGSLVDLNADGHLDLVVTSDFAGVDLYYGDGRGQFRDVTEEVLDERHAFGASHALADFNRDGKLDLFVAGVSAPTARRLDRLGLVREDRRDIDPMRGVMGHGNRLYLSRGEKFVQTAWAGTVARTGWSFGCTALDFDNDGDRDLYVANGNQSGKSAQDYASIFWRHDLYTGTSRPDSSVDLVFDEALKPFERLEISWGGFDYNSLLVNRRGRGMVDVAYLLGLAQDFDGRSVVADDFDADGRMDLLVTDRRTGGPTGLKQRLFVFRNKLPGAGHWIGVRLNEQGGGRSPLGAVVKVFTADGMQLAPIAAGTSFAAQHPPAAHFGLGAATRVDRVEIHWPNGDVERIDAPGVDRWHTVGPAAPRGRGG